MKAAPCSFARPTRSAPLRSNSSKFGARATGVDVIRQQQGSDPSSVVYTAVEAARARKVDYVIVDTAGRLHTKDNLMAELEKMQPYGEEAHSRMRRMRSCSSSTPRRGKTAWSRLADSRKPAESPGLY